MEKVYTLKQVEDMGREELLNLLAHAEWMANRCSYWMQQVRKHTPADEKDPEMEDWESTLFALSEYLQAIGVDGKDADDRHESEEILDNAFKCGAKGVEAEFSAPPVYSCRAVDDSRIEN